MLTLNRLYVKGMRSLAEIDLPLQNFTIFIGKNNAGKTNTLLAIKLLLEASARDVSEEDFYKTDTERADTIELRGEFSVPEEYLFLCDEKHKGKIQNCMVDNILTVRRIINIGEGGKIKVNSIELWQPDKGEFGTPTGIDAGIIDRLINK